MKSIGEFIYNLNEVMLESGGIYQLAFYVGESEGSLWIDEVKLSVGL